MGFHSKTKEEILKELKTSEKGLSQKEAQKRLLKHGKNILKKTHKLNIIKIIFEQFKSFLIYILLIAVVVSFLIGNLIDGIIILAIVILNASIGFFQQYRAEKALIGLRSMLVPLSIVIRNGKHQKIPSSKIVPGDILIFELGDKVNADCRILESENLQTNEAVLTGESMPVNKFEEKLPLKTILVERLNMLYTGTQITRGSAKAVVVATGMNSEFGKIATELQEIKTQKTPMQKRLNKFSKQLGFIILGIVLIIMFLGFLEHFDKLEMFMTSVALAVSAIPEGLPAALAISFAISSVFMSKKNVIIRKFPAVESLGSVTIICCDKTGTLTEEEMHVQEIFTNGKLFLKKENKILLNNKQIDLTTNKEFIQLIKTSILCNDARFEELESGGYSFTGDSTEEALVRLALDLKINKKKLTEDEPKIKEFEFDSNRKMMSVLRRVGKKNVLYSKGAPEKIISKSSFEIINGQIKKLSEKRKRQLISESEKIEERAFRVLGFAYKDFSEKSKVEEKGLVFLGFMGMIDPPRKEVKDAIRLTKSAGIKVKIITGDSALTAKAIAMQIGIQGEIMTGAELEKITEGELGRVIDKISIFARTNPQQKLKIVKVLQQNKEMVAVTGDGINDVLALKSADLGIAMGQRGTDVARDVSDMVLIDDNFASIVEGVKEGRKTYDNVKKFTKYLLAVNFSEILLIIVALLMKMPLPLIPLQILWINLITDSFPALTMVFEKEENVMKTKPRKEKSLLNGVWKFILIGGLLNFIVCFAVYLIGINNGLVIEQIRTMVLTTGILFELFFIYTCRSKKPLLEIGIFSNKWLNYAIIFALAAQFILLYTPLAIVFGVVPLTIQNWLFILPFAVSGLIVFEIGKYFRRRSKSN